MNKVLIAFFLLTLISSPMVSAQEVIEIEPLFEYPVAPEELKSLNEKCEYLVKNFWNNFDFKSKEPVDQHALNAAFQVFTTSIQYAGRKEVEQSVSKLLDKISGNPMLLMQFTKAAEENLYGPRANYWSDELYLKFLEQINKNKKIPASRKNKYKIQEEVLRKSAIGETAPSFWFTDKERASKNYFPMSTPTILIFGDPTDTDWRLTRLRMESNTLLSEALTKGKINILFIIPYETDNWIQEVSNYNSKWTVGQSDEIAKIYDLRLSPSVFVVGSDGKIISKLISLEEAIDIVLESAN